ncbi:hypothetical protein Vadar_030763 [Vaccinium darrowii]|uniref:Uncharacterized protein n=1 Tax=Vaccinium darrowii TaxID=229202 RepID=A0ACB7XV97_9ERIC|nr:hypothetical protein Vadar_030763 [Vaccinium darrowii]
MAELDPKEWRLYVDGSACNKGSEAGVVLFSPEGLVLEQAQRLGFSATNNVAEYEALLAGLRSAMEFKVSKLKIFYDSQLVVNQLLREYATKSEKMAAYSEAAKDLLDKFGEVHIQQISSGQNAHVDSLAYLGSTVKMEYHRTVAVDYLSELSIGWAVEMVMETKIGPSWMDPIMAYLRDGTLPEDKREAHKIRTKSIRF